MPTGQVMHSCVAVFIFFPAAQSPQEGDAPKLPLPVGQDVQVVAKDIFVYVSRGQFLH